jgi:dCTP deaminase
MILSDVEIKAAIDARHIIVDPRPDAGAFTTSALDLHLGCEFKKWKKPPPGMGVTIDPSADGFSYTTIAKDYLELTGSPEDGVVLAPGTLVLGITAERIELPTESRYAARVEGRSTLARLGLSVHITAPTVHAGFRGAIVLEMLNAGAHPIHLRPGLAVCQLIFEQVFGTPGRQMESEFQDQKTVTGRG